MTVSGVLNSVRDRWKLLLASVAICVIVASIGTALLPRQYSSSTLLYVSAQNSAQNAQSAYQGGLLSADRVKSYVEIVTSQRVGTEVARRLNLPMTPEQIIGALTASSAPDTVLINITATADDPVLASELVNSSATVFTEIVQEVERPLDATSPPLVAARVIQPGLPSTDPVSPSVVLNLALALLVGLAIGVGGAIGRDRLDATVRSEQAAVESSGVPNLASLSLTRGSTPNRAEASDQQDKINAEEIRRLRTNLSFVDLDGHRRVLTITSANAAEGKSSTCIGLAAAIAAAGRRVVIVEADLRKPSIAKYLSLEPAVGLTSILSRRVRLAEAIQQVPGERGVSVVTSGPTPPNPSEILGSEQMRLLTDELRGAFDYVLIDSPPLFVTDAAALGRACDGYLLVIRHGHTTALEASRAAESLRQAGGSLLGNILTMVPHTKRTSYNYAAYYGGPPEVASLSDDSPTTEVASHQPNRPTPRPR